MASLACSSSLASSSTSSASLFLPSTLPTSRFCPPPLFSRSPPRLSTVAMANPPTATDMNKQLAESIKKAEELCAGNSDSPECAAAWDEVEEISAEIAHRRVKAMKDNDPLENYCKESPEADECRVYED